jgi:serine/threonine protein kinase
MMPQPGPQGRARSATIGRYQIRDRLGEGGMGVLYLALDPAIDRLVALKVLRVDSVELRERFIREAQFAARLQHPHIVTIYDVGSHDGQPFIAMEYIPGETSAG